MRKLAIKKLKPSDLSFFKSYLDQHPQTKQKGFNLDKSVLEKQFFPALHALLVPLPKKTSHVDLTIFGPGCAAAHSLARKVKIDSKNFRLNGEFVDGPVGDSNRYDVMAPGDFAIMEFIGVALPNVVNVVLVAAAHAEDASLHGVLQSRLPSPTASMKSLSEDELGQIIQSANPGANHPIYEWLDTALLEEVGSGDTMAVEKLNYRRPGRGLSPIALKASKDAAERVGQLGEELLDQYFSQGNVPGLTQYEWVAQTNAISPFDFLLIVGQQDRHADAKSTSSRFVTPLHLSTSEIRHAVDSGTPYDIYRLFEVKDSSALLRVAKDVGSQLNAVLDVLKTLPSGVKVDSLSFDPSFFTFDAEIYQVQPANDDEDAED